jgi:hypothetical protein
MKKTNDGIVEVGEAMKYRIRFKVTVPCSSEYNGSDSWVTDGNIRSARQMVIRLGYKYMAELVNDALYNPDECTIEFIDNSMNFNMPMAIIKNKGIVLYSVESFMIIQVDPTHFKYRNFVITVDASHGDNGVCHVVDGRNGFYETSFDIINDSVKDTLDNIYNFIDHKLSKEE